MPFQDILPVLYSVNLLYFYWHIRIISKRFFHSSISNKLPVKSSALGELRKSTGYSISNCKKALELFQGDIIKAEEWLHAEAQKKGWSKWAKIQTRSASQGLIGICVRDKIAAMVEVNCETDFVAKNVDFHHFVANVLSSCLNHIEIHQSNEDIIKLTLDEQQLNSLKFESTTIGDLIGATTYKFNEKTVTKRAVCLKTPQSYSLTGLSHPNNFCSTLPGSTVGKYGTLLVCKHKNDDNMKDVERDLCQHIIGMNPLSIGYFTEQDLIDLQKQKDAEKNKKHIEQENPLENQGSENEENASILKSETEEDYSIDEIDSEIPEIKDTNETRLLFQPFLLDPQVLIGETVIKSGIEIIHFERYECGETHTKEQKIEACSASS